MKLDRRIFRPVMVGYRHIFPQPVRTGIHNVITLITEPVVLLNDVLQLRFHQAGETTIRIAANSTVGLAGLIDVAGRTGIPHHDNGFGTTLGRYGVPPGPYLFFPISGPSTVRDFFGFGVDIASQPYQYLDFDKKWLFGLSVFTVRGIDERLQNDAKLTDIFETSADPYAALRSLYLQDRQKAIHGEVSLEKGLPEIPPETPPAPEAGAPVPEAPPAAGEPQAGPPPPAPPPAAGPGATPSTGMAPASQLKVEPASPETPPVSVAGASAAPSAAGEPQQGSPPLATPPAAGPGATSSTGITPASHVQVGPPSPGTPPEPGIDEPISTGLPPVSDLKLDPPPPDTPPAPDPQPKPQAAGGGADLGRFDVRECFVTSLVDPPSC